MAVVVAVAVVPLVLVAVAVAVVVGLSTTGSGRNHTTTTTAQPLPNLLTLGGLSGFLSQMRAKFGDTMGYELDVRPDSATLYRPETANAHKTVEWWYDQNGWENKGNSHIPPDMTTGDDTIVGDLSKFDVQAVIAVVSGAPQRVHIDNPASTWMAIYSVKTPSLNKTGKLKLEIYVSDTTDNTASGKIQLAADGTVTQTSPANS